jgi:hypothetical protein
LPRDREFLRVFRCLLGSFQRVFSQVKHRSRSYDAVIRVYDEAGSVIETHEHKGDFKAW